MASSSSIADGTSTGGSIGGGGVGSGVVGGGAASTSAVLLGSTPSAAAPLPAAEKQQIEESVLRQKLKIFIVVLSYFAVSLSMVFLNKSVILTSSRSLSLVLTVPWVISLLTNTNTPHAHINSSSLKVNPSPPLSL
jgi:hypothetical protein